MPRPGRVQTKTTAAARRRKLAADLDVMLEARNVSFTEWSERIPTAKGLPLDFARFPYQRDLYATCGDASIAEVVVMKSVQVGVSELLARLTLFYPAIHGCTALYVFPALKQMLDFSVARVDRLVENSEYLRSITRRANERTWNRGLKSVGRGFVYYRGSESKNDLIAVDADVLALDEYDQLDARNVPEAEKRVAASGLGLVRRVGIPSDPEFGIAKLFDDSDRRRWLVACRRRGCGEKWQELTFHGNVRWDESAGVIENPRIVCRRCQRRLDVLGGKWVAEYSDRHVPGFHVHRLMVPGDRNLRMVIEDSKKTEPTLIRKFWNNDLGLPYTERAAGLDRTAIAAAVSAAESFGGEPLIMADGFAGTNLVTMGIDVASTRTLNVRISEHVDPLHTPGHRKRGLWIGEVDSFDELPILMHRYNVTFACIDYLPEYRLAFSFAQQFPGRVYLVNYATARQVVPLVVKTEDLRVTADRTIALDACIDLVRGQRNLLPINLPLGYVEQMVAPRRVVTRNEFDQVTVKWEERGPTDYFHAEVYDLLATEVAKVRLAFEELVREEVWQLDERLGVNRSRVNDYDEMEYRAGPTLPLDPEQWFSELE